MPDPKIGPADPATRRRLIEEKMAENRKGDRTYQRPPPPSTDSIRGTPVIEGQRRANAIESIVEHAQRGGAERQSSYPRK